MADEYITKEQAKVAFDDSLRLSTKEWNMVFDGIDALPAADVVPIVRCKECKHGTRLVCDLAGNEGIECRHGNIAHRLDWFCADGAKMDTKEQEAVYDPDKFFGRMRG